MRNRKGKRAPTEENHSLKQGNKDIERLRHDLDHCDLHHAIFGDSLATGNNAAPSTNPYLRQGNNVNECDSSEDEDNDATTLYTGHRSGDKRVGLSWERKGKQKKRKIKEDYKSNMSALASILVTRLEKGVNSEQSRQSGPQEKLLGQVVDIVSALPDLSDDQIVRAFEFFRINPDAQPLLLRMPVRFRSSYIRTVVP